MERHPRHFARDLCLAWGLDPNRVSRIDVALTPIGWPQATVTFVLDERMRLALSQALLELQPREPSE